MQHLAPKLAAMTAGTTAPKVHEPAAAVSARLFNLSIGIFFIGGFLTAIVSLLVPRFRLLLHFGYAEALLVQLASHMSYLLFAVPITVGIVRIGYMRAIATGLGVMALGCIAIAAADSARSFAVLLAALLLLALGITFLQIAANTVVTVTGAARTSAARLTLLQGFNSLGTVLGPLVAAPLLLVDRPIVTAGVPFLLSALFLGGLAAAFVVWRDMLGRTNATARPDFRRQLARLRRDRRVIAGTAAMFAYVGAEVTIGALLTNYLMRGEIIAADAVTAGRMVSLYWGGAMLGRFAGSALLGRIDPAVMLAVAATGAGLLTLAATGATGATGAAALLLVGVFNSIMYPTIYALALPTDPEAAPVGSMLLCMAVVGGAVLPLATGLVADRAGLAPSLVIPALCYAGIALFAQYCRGAKR